MSEQQPESSEALDGLYEALAEVHAHLHEHDQERQSLLKELEATEKDLLGQRAAAAKAGERDTYDRLSKDLANLTRAWRVAQEDPDADPLEEYQYDESEPTQPQETGDGDLPVSVPEGPSDGDPDADDGGDPDERGMPDMPVDEGEQGVQPARRNPLSRTRLLRNRRKGNAEPEAPPERG